MVLSVDGGIGPSPTDSLKEGGREGGKEGGRWSRGGSEIFCKGI